MSNTANRWKSKGGITRRPMGNIVSNNKSVIMENIITKSLGAELTTIDKYGDIDDMNDGAIYKVDNSSINYNNVVCYYPFNNLTYNGDVLPATTNQTSISNESKYDALLDPTNMNLTIQNATSGFPPSPWVVYDSQYEQNAIQFRDGSKILITDASFNTANVFGTTSITGPSITTAMTVASYIYIPSGTQNFTIFALDDSAQTGLQNYSLDASANDISHHMFYLWYRGDGYIQMAYYYSYTTVYDDPNSPITHISNKYKYINTAIDGTTIDSIVKDKWSKFQMIFNGSSLDLYIDGKEIFHVPTGTASFIPDKPMSINLGPYYLYTTDVPGTPAGTPGNTFKTNWQSPADTGVQLLDYKIANYAVSKTLIEFLADPVAGRGHQFVKTQQPNSTGEMIYLLSKEAILFDAPTLCQDTLNVGGQLNSYGSNNFYSKNQFFDVAHFHKGVIIDGSSVIINSAQSAVGNLDIFSTGSATNKPASLFICNAGGMNPLTTGNSSMPTMLAYNADIPPTGNSTNGLIFSISGENVSVGEIFGTNTFDVSGNSVFQGDVGIYDNLSVTRSATIGQNVDIVGGATIGTSAVIGGTATIGSNAIIDGNAEIGQNAEIGGNLGIGTTTLDAKLHVKQDLDNAVIQRWDHGGRVLDLITPSDTGDPFIFSTGNAYQFQRDQVVALDINASGNVGIQKTVSTNTYSLDVSGNVNVSGSINCANPAETEDSNIVATTEWVRTYITGPVAGWTADGTTTTTDLNVTVGGNVTVDGQISSNDAMLCAHPDVTENSNIVPTTKWVLDHTSDSGGGWSVANGTTTTTYNATIGGNVGIGTSSPRSLLDVNGCLFVKNQNVTFDYGGGGNTETSKYSLVFNTPSNGNSGRTLALKTNDNSALCAYSSSGGTFQDIWKIGGHHHDENDIEDTYFCLTDGNFGIGTTTPSEKLDVNGNVNVTGSIRCNNPSGNEYSNMVATTRWVIDHTSDSGGGWSADTATATTTTTYNVGIGTTTPRSSLDVNGCLFVKNQPVTFDYGGIDEDTDDHHSESGSYSLIFNTPNLDGTPGRTLALKTGTNSALYAWSSGGDPSTFKKVWKIGGIHHDENDVEDTYFCLTDGNFGIGTTTPSEKLHVNGNIKGTAFIATSDARHKENICDLDRALEKICSIRGVNFNFKDDDNDNNSVSQKHAGILAQEVHEIIPEAIYKKDHDKWAANYNTFIGYLIESVKTLKKENDEYKKDKEEQQSRIETLESKMEAQGRLIQKLMDKMN